jgi:hypothetical protein
MTSLGVLGSAALEEVDRLRQTGIEFDEQRHDGLTEFEVQGQWFTLRISVEPGALVSLIIDVRTCNGRRLQFELDTGDYDFSRGQYLETALAIERDVIAGLRAYAERQMLVGHDGRDLVLLVPGEEGTDVVRRGRFVTSTRKLSSRSALKASLVPLQQWQGGND